MRVAPAITIPLLPYGKNGRPSVEQLAEFSRESYYHWLLEILRSELPLNPLFYEAGESGMPQAPATIPQ